MKRPVIDAYALERGLDSHAVADALDASGARPDAKAWRVFAARLAHGAGIASLGAGLVFFIAANWSEFGSLGRFVLVELAIAACAGTALWRPPPDRIGRGALVLAIVATGGLLALFGQTYQTGADLYELFLTWAVLALPFALAARWDGAWATWWIVLNIGMALFCGWLGPEHLMWSWLDRWGAGKPLVLMIPFVVNLAGAAIFLHLRHARWLVRLLASIAFLYATSASVMAIGWSRNEAMAGQNLALIAVFAAVSIALAAVTLRRKRDVFPMVLVMASWMAISTVALVDKLHFNGESEIFVVALWLVVSSTVAGVLLTRWVRLWRIDEDAPEATA